MPPGADQAGDLAAAAAALPGAVHDPGTGTVTCPHAALPDLVALASRRDGITVPPEVRAQAAITAAADPRDRAARTRTSRRRGRRGRRRTGRDHRRGPGVRAAPPDPRRAHRRRRRREPSARLSNGGRPAGRAAARRTRRRQRRDGHHPGRRHRHHRRRPGRHPAAQPGLAAGSAAGWLLAWAAAAARCWRRPARSSAGTPSLCTATASPATPGTRTCTPTPPNSRRPPAAAQAAVIDAALAANGPGPLPRRLTSPARPSPGPALFTPAAADDRAVQETAARVAALAALLPAGPPGWDKPLAEVQPGDLLHENAGEPGAVLTVTAAPRAARLQPGGDAMIVEGTVDGADGPVTKQWIYYGADPDTPVSYIPPAGPLTGPVPPPPAVPAERDPGDLTRQGRDGETASARDRDRPPAASLADLLASVDPSERTRELLTAAATSGLDPRRLHTSDGFHVVAFGAPGGPLSGLLYIRDTTGDITSARIRRGSGPEEPLNDPAELLHLVRTPRDPDLGAAPAGPSADPDSEERHRGRLRGFMRRKHQLRDALAVIAGQDPGFGAAGHLPGAPARRQRHRPMGHRPEPAEPARGRDRSLADPRRLSRPARPRRNQLRPAAGPARRRHPPRQPAQRDPAAGASTGSGRIADRDRGRAVPGLYCEGTGQDVLVHLPAAPPDSDLAADASALAGDGYDPGTGTCTCPPAALHAAVAFADQHGIPVTPEARALAATTPAPPPAAT